MSTRTVTIVFTDVASSTDQLARHVDQTAVPALLQLIAAQSAAVVDSGGQVVKTLGDGVMAVFASAADAIRAASAIQRRVVQLGGGAGVRVGIHTGDVIDAGAGSDLVGLPVVIARRLCDHGTSGQIHVSAVAAAVAGGLVDVEVEWNGLLQLKGVPDSVPAVRIQWTADIEAAPVRVVVAEDVAIVRAGLVALLREEGFDVVGEAADRDGLIDVVRRLRPALVITDVRMPPTQTDEGITAAAELRAAQPDIAVLVLSQHVEPAAAALLLTNNPTAVGYVLKERVSHIDEFIAACRTVAGGGVVIDALVTERLMLGGDEVLSRLSEREREVLELMAQGRSNVAIARALHCSAKTLETHIRSLFLKLDLLDDPDENRRVAAVVRYLASHR